MRIQLREAGLEDRQEIVRLFRETIRTVNIADYSVEEAEDWAACGEKVGYWEDLIGKLYFIVAEVVDGKTLPALSVERNEKGPIIGFASISDDGYLHAVFVHKDYQRCGVGTALLQTLERYAAGRNILKIVSEVSITARPFFEHEGFRVVKEQRRKAMRLELKNFVMEKAKRDD